ncbi:hypothetical protein [Deinococcus hopiensis]|uniref:Uncharacterized protein n=1 Tax=Deinococcus hopiensis KR-140 TaxID=695939 RepID=A0A1W1VJQ0_9DEIO|nr:hypothetical protein [Deinococcus hopiensis]SMB93164.1 hypothetical protein SAMN00790413_01871 [Deinococcus hopiensis KR-140]
MKKTALMGVEFSSWKAGGLLHPAAAVEGDNAEVRAALLAALLELQGMTVEVAPCRATDGSLIFVDVSAEAAA